MRYAIYHTAGKDNPLSHAAAEWLGRDVHTGADVRQPVLDWLASAELMTLTSDPRRYGFHGTLKAPFHLRANTLREDMIAEIERFAAATPAVMLDAGLKIARLGPFFALVPATPSEDLAAFAGICVRTFEPYRAPLAEADLERRRKARLTANQDAHLVQWGYPYVFDEFRFHMTLTGRTAEPLHAPMRQELEQRFAAFTGRAYLLDTLSLFSQAEPDQAFQVEASFCLKKP